MAVKIKLTRLGSKKHPFYRIVATNLENARDSRPLEFLGHYNPMLSPAEVVLDAEKIQKWLDRARHPQGSYAQGRGLISFHAGTG